MMTSQCLHETSKYLHEDNTMQYHHISLQPLEALLHTDYSVQQYNETDVYVGALLHHEFNFYLSTLFLLTLKISSFQCLPLSPSGCRGISVVAWMGSGHIIYPILQKL